MYISDCTYKLHFAISQRTVGGRAYQLTFQFVTIYLNCFKLCNYVLSPLRLLLVSLSMAQWVQPFSEFVFDKDLKNVLSKLSKWFVQS